MEVIGASFIRLAHESSSYVAFSLLPVCISHLLSHVWNQKLYMTQILHEEIGWRWFGQLKELQACEKPCTSRKCWVGIFCQQLPIGFYFHKGLTWEFSIFRLRRWWSSVLFLQYLLLQHIHGWMLRVRNLYWLLRSLNDWWKECTKLSL